jgi:hypothetical protein
LQEFLDFADAGVKIIDGVHNGFEAGALLAQCLCVFGFLPD